MVQGGVRGRPLEFYDLANNLPLPARIIISYALKICCKGGLSPVWSKQADEQFKIITKIQWLLWGLQEVPAGSKMAASRCEKQRKRQIS